MGYSPNRTGKACKNVSQIRQTPAFPHFPSSVRNSFVWMFSEQVQSLCRHQSAKHLKNQWKYHWKPISGNLTLRKVALSQSLGQTRTDWNWSSIFCAKTDCFCLTLGDFNTFQEQSSSTGGGVRATMLVKTKMKSHKLIEKKVSWKFLKISEKNWKVFKSDSNGH